MTKKGIWEEIQAFLDVWLNVGLMVSVSQYPKGWAGPSHDSLSLQRLLKNNSKKVPRGWTDPFGR